MKVLNYKLHIIYSLSFALTHRREHIPPPPYTHNYLNTSAHAWSISASRPIISWRMQRHLKCKSRLGVECQPPATCAYPSVHPGQASQKRRDGDYRRGRQEAGLFPVLTRAGAWWWYAQCLDHATKVPVTAKLLFIPHPTFPHPTRHHPYPSRENGRVKETVRKGWALAARKILKTKEGTPGNVCRGPIEGLAGNNGQWLSNFTLLWTIDGD